MAALYVRQIVSDPRAREKPCLRCGLSLRKHLDDRHCPQCGLSVWMSLNANDSLEYSNATWLRKASRGAWVMAGIQVVAFLAYLTFLFAYISSTVQSVVDVSAAVQRAATQVSTQPTTQPAITPDVEDIFESGMVERMAPIPTSIATLLTGVYFVLEAGGLVLLTPHEHRYPDKAGGIRVAARVAAGVSVLFGAALLALGIGVLITGHATNSTAIWLLTWLIEIVFAGCAFCAWLWLRRIARRAGKSSLAKLCSYLLFLPVLPFLKAAPIFGLWFLYLLTPLLHFLPLIYIPLSVYLLARCGYILNRAVADAESTWANETKQPGNPATIA